MPVYSESESDATLGSIIAFAVLSQIPVPLSVVDLADAPPPGVTFKLADLMPVEVGLKATLAEHFPPTGT